MTTERDYVLGTHDDEISRLGLQHDIWRPRAYAAWQRAGFTIGQTVLDVGCGPGYATLDLAELVGPTGHVIAIDRSRRFLDTLDERRRARGIDSVTTIESDLDDVVFDVGVADVGWCRWVLAFVLRPRDLLAKISRALKPGGVFVSHEYFDYGTWRALPRSPGFESFVQMTIDGWRQSGGEPDVGLNVPRWLEELGFEIVLTKPIIDVITPRDYMWNWPASFMDVGFRRLRDLGAIDDAHADSIRDALRDVATSPTARMITPGLIEVIARKR